MLKDTLLSSYCSSLFSYMLEHLYSYVHFYLVLIRNVADNGGDSINYHWRLLTSPAVEEKGYGLDSISILMPGNRNSFSAVISTIEDDNYCVINWHLFSSEGKLGLNKIQECIIKFADKIEVLNVKK